MQEGVKLIGFVDDLEVVGTAKYLEEVIQERNEVVATIKTVAIGQRPKTG